jgi:hypothetical protein
MSSTLTLLGDPSVADTLAGLTDLTRTRLLALDFEPGSAPETWVYDAAVVLVRQLKKDAEEGVLATTRTLVVASFAAPTTDQEIIQREATVQAVRGIVQSVTREFANRSDSMNFIVVDRDAPEDAQITLDYLDDPDGGYTAGFTFDLTKETV